MCVRLLRQHRRRGDERWGLRHLPAPNPEILRVSKKDKELSDLVRKYS